MRQLLLTISYDGVDFHGWQRQINLRTVQQVVEEKLSILTGEEILITGCSRTDAGVHALAQKATFSTECPIPVERVPQALNGLLPKDIMVTDCQVVDKGFHPRFDACRKRYGYTINTQKYIDIRNRRYCWHLTESLNYKAMQEACQSLIGTQDFKAFCASGSQVKTTVRTIYRADISQTENGTIYFVIEGDGFLYKMVRIVVGTLVDIGMGKYSTGYIKKAIQSGLREYVTRTAPPEGLCLEKVWFHTENHNKNLT